MTTREKLEHHVTRLENKVARLKDECREAYMQGSDIQWENLKKKKLRIKDELEECKRQLESMK